MKMFKFHALALAGSLLLSPLVLQAQTLPTPAEFYFDEDRAAQRELDNQRGEGDALVSRLLRSIERDPRAWAISPCPVAGRKSAVIFMRAPLPAPVTVTA